MRFLNCRKSDSELADADADVVLVEDPHHHRLAVVRRQDAHAEVVVLAVGRELDAAVLRAAPLGDVELGEDLDAREDGAEEPAGRVVALHEPAVDPVADPHAILEGLDVDVAGPQLHRLGDDQVDELHDGRVGGVLWVRAGGLLERRLREVDGGVGELLEHRVGALAVGQAVVAVDRLHDLLPQREHRLDLAVEDEAELLLHVDVGRVAGGHREHAAVLGQREDRVLAGHALRQEPHHLLRHRVVGEGHELEAVGPRQGLHHGLARRVAEPHELVVDRAARGAGETGRLGELLGRDDAVGDEDLGKRVGHVGPQGGRRQAGGSRNVSACS
jgi:hypothetical protein